MLKLERNDAADGTITIRLYGRIGGEWVAELEDACVRAVRDRGDSVRLDLADVTFIDHAGLEFFRRMWPELVIVRSSLFAAEQLKPLSTADAAR